MLVKYIVTHVVYYVCILCSDFSQWLVEQKEVGSLEEAVTLGQALLDNGIIHHGITK